MVTTPQCPCLTSSLTTATLGSLKVDACTMLVLCMLCVFMQVPVSGLQARFSHCAAAFSLAPGLTEVTIFGGCPEIPSNFKTDTDIQPIADTTVLVLGEWACRGLLHAQTCGNCWSMVLRIEN